MTSKFDPNAFLEMQVKGANSTSIPPLPEHEATLVIDELKLKTTDDFVILDVVFIVDSEEAREATDMKEPKLRHGIFLDVDEKTGGIDMGEGKNVGLGKLREALGQNDPNEPWSPNMMVGQVCRGHIVQDPDKKDPEKIYNRIKSFAMMD